MGMWVKKANHTQEKSQIKWERSGQDGGGRPRAHRLPCHTKVVSIYRATVDEKDQKTSSKDLLQQKL